jgi:malonyl-CoA/methylmalonyl-CoA synthetase
MKIMSPPGSRGMSTNENLFARVAAAFARDVAQPLFELADGTSVSRASTLARSHAMAGALIAAGVAPGDRVMVQAEKSVAAVALYLATLQIGAIYNPLNTAYTSAEMAYFLTDAEPKVVVAPAARLSQIADHARNSGAAALFSLEADGLGTLIEAALSARLFTGSVPRSKDDLAALAYTSGTTGRSKGAMLTHGNLTSNALTLIDLWQLARGERLIHALPIYHVHGLFVALDTALLGGMTMLWMEKFEAARVMAALPKADVMMGVPTFYTRLLSEPSLDRYACRNMRLFVSGSAPLLPETHKDFHARTGHAILERYGMTETGMIASNPYTGERIAGTVGYPLTDVSVRVADGTGSELPRGEIGVVEVRGPNVFSGYWQMPEKTAEEFRDGGWFITGDQGVMAADGRLSLVGRAKDLIITGGLNVYPIEVEQALNALPGIGESAVIGVPHPDFGEAVVAVVTGAGAVAPDEAVIIATLTETLAKFKCPKRVFVVPELPRNAMGKVTKAELRTTHKGLFVS